MKEMAVWVELNQNKRIRKLVTKVEFNQKE